ncbi:MAG: Ku protein [Acidimicrobiales bacterium]|nr:Ku protein [Acidimicrobiales bacterium]
MLWGMPRAMWSGSISFGLVNIPIKLYSAVSRKNVRFHQIDSRSGSRVRQKRVSEATGEEVPYEAMAKGYELASGQYVLVSEDELAALDPEASRTIDIEEFVELVDIDPIYYDASYFIAPDKATVKPYALLVKAMEDAGKVGIARFVMRSKQYLAAIRAVDGKLVLSTMVYADEVNDADEIPEMEPVAGVEVNDREVQMAEQLIASLAADFEPGRHHDTHREKVLELVERKAAGDDSLVETPAPVAQEKVVDLMAALEASVAAAKKSRQRHPTARDDADEDEGADEADAAPKKRARSRKTA